MSKQSVCSPEKWKTTPGVPHRRYAGSDLNPWNRGLFLAAALLAVFTAAHAEAAQAKKIDLNSATAQELEALPGIGAANARKMIAGRPYSSVADLAKAGLSSSTIEKISPLVTARRAPAAGKQHGKRACFLKAFYETGAGSREERHSSPCQTDRPQFCFARGA